jgi:hypothetical protein
MEYGVGEERGEGWSVSFCTWNMVSQAYSVFYSDTSVLHIDFDLIIIKGMLA